MKKMSLLEAVFDKFEFDDDEHNEDYAHPFVSSQDDDPWRREGEDWHKEEIRLFNNFAHTTNVFRKALDEYNRYLQAKKLKPLTAQEAIDIESRYDKYNR